MDRYEFSLTWYLDHIVYALNQMGRNTTVVLLVRFGESSRIVRSPCSGSARADFLRFVFVGEGVRPSYSLSTGNDGLQQWGLGV